MQCAEQAAVMQKIGAWQAMALDGGGSTTVWGQGKLLLPSGGGCRAISTALLVVPRPRIAPSSAAAAAPAPAAPGLASVTGLTPESAPPVSGQ